MHCSDKTTNFYFKGASLIHRHLLFAFNEQHASLRSMAKDMLRRFEC